MAVKVDINVRNLELSDRLQEYVVKKVGKLDRYLGALESAKVDLAYVKSVRNAQDRQVAQLTVRGRGILLRAEERTDDIFASVDAALEKVHRQIERYKGRRRRGRGDGHEGHQGELASDELVLEAGDVEESIVRRKSFLLTPMFEQEAVEQMGLVGHRDFFVFLNADTNVVNILYRRRDGTLGLIEALTR